MGPEITCHLDQGSHQRSALRRDEPVDAALVDHCQEVPEKVQASLIVGIHRSVPRLHDVESINRRRMRPTFTSISYFAAIRTAGRLIRVSGMNDRMLRTTNPGRTEFERAVAASGSSTTANIAAQPIHAPRAQRRRGEIRTEDSATRTGYLSGKVASSVAVEDPSIADPP
ncbi:hypothetical protein OH799_08195 [Nocardia sp. NBC_00881]|uniref:hypothetical protein n=1 Tax=Nocardia sp. NBC_00881 TaxID=2975995 RepID=UPI00386A4F6D|nr:hypothetical protein OH799_08195 [Nocardia sp. NBC_00881]